MASGWASNADKQVARDGKAPDDLQMQRVFTEFIAPAKNVSAEVLDHCEADRNLTMQTSTNDSAKTVKLEDAAQEPWIIQAKNTFINVKVVREELDSSMPRNKSDQPKRSEEGDPSMPRNKSDPMKRVAECEKPEKPDALPPGLPPPLSLEHVTTHDPFQVDSNLGPISETSCEQPPPPLLLESIVTYDPFQDLTNGRMMDCSSSLDIETNASHPPIIELSLDRIVTDDSFVTPQSVNLPNQSLMFSSTTGPSCSPLELCLDRIVTDDPSLHQLSLDRVVKDDPIQSCSAPNMLRGPSGELSLDRIVTDDPLQSFSASDVLPGLPRELSLDRIVTDDQFPTFSASDMLQGPPGELSLDRYETDDSLSFNSHIAARSSSSIPNSSQLLSSATVSAPMYVILPGTSNVQPRAPPAPPIAPPVTMAPTLEAPAAPDAPLAPPSHTPGASLAALLKTDLCQPGLLVRAHGNCTHVHWAVDARKLERQDKQAVSPVFQVELPNFGSASFKILLNALEKKVAGDRKKGAGFHRAKGHGRVALKCEAELPECCAEIAMRIGVGRNETLQPLRGPAVQNFFSNSCHGLETDSDEWNFAKSVDEHSLFLVTIEIAPEASYRANPNIWWASDKTD